VSGNSSGSPREVQEKNTPHFLKQEKVCPAGVPIQKRGRKKFGKGKRKGRSDRLAGKGVGGRSLMQKEELGTEGGGVAVVFGSERPTVPHTRKFIVH